MKSNKTNDNFSSLKVARYLKLPWVIHERGNEISYDEIQFSLLTMQMHFTFTALALPYPPPPGKFYKRNSRGNSRRPRVWAGCTFP